MTVYEFIKAAPYGNFDLNVYSSGNLRLLDSFDRNEKNQIGKVKSKYGVYKIVAFSFSDENLEVFVKTPMHNNSMGR